MISRRNNIEIFKVEKANGSAAGPLASRFVIDRRPATGAGDAYKRACIPEE